MNVAVEPWEVVEGDVWRVRKIGWGSLLLWSSSAGIAAIWTVESYVPAYSIPLGGLPLAWLAPFSWLILAGIGLHALTYSSRWQPLVARLWIGRQGLRIELAFRTLAVPWSRVERIGSDSVVIRGALGGSKRFALTYPQASQLDRFLHVRK